MLKLRLDGKREFRQSEIEERAYHRPCAGCQPNARSSTECSTCQEFGSANTRPPMQISYRRIAPDENSCRRQLREERDEGKRAARLAQHQEESERNRRRHLEEEQARQAKLEEDSRKTQDARRTQRERDQEYRAQLHKNPKGILRG